MKMNNKFFILFTYFINILFYILKISKSKLYFIMNNTKEDLVNIVANRLAGLLHSSNSNDYSNLLS